jgi:hypothetical protein
VGDLRAVQIEQHQLGFAPADAPARFATQACDDVVPARHGKPVENDGGRRHGEAGGPGRGRTQCDDFRPREQRGELGIRHEPRVAGDRLAR